MNCSPKERAREKRVSKNHHVFIEEVKNLASNNKTTKPKEEDFSFSAVSVVRGRSPLHYKLLCLELDGKELSDVELVMEEILPIVLAKASQILKEKGKL